MSQFYKFQIGFFLLVLIIFINKNSIGQSWKYSDSLNITGFNSFEFNDKYLVASTFMDSNNISEPEFIVLSKSGVFLERVKIPLFSLNLERGILTTFVELNSDSFILAGLSYGMDDSLPYLTVCLINRNFKVISIKTNKIAFSYGIPSRSYSFGVNLYNDSLNKNLYGSISICSTVVFDGVPNLSSYSWPCYHNFFKITYSGDIFYNQAILANFNNSMVGYLTNSSIDIKKKSPSYYLISSIGEGQAILNDSFQIIKKSPRLTGEYFFTKYSNNLIRWKQGFISIGSITYDESIGDQIYRVNLTHNRILVNEISNEGDIYKSKLIRPFLDKDSATFKIFKHDTLFASYQSNLSNAIICGSQLTSNGTELFFVYRNSTGSSFIVKLDSNLSIVWTKEVKLDYHNLFSVYSTSDGGCLLTGWSYMDNNTQSLPIFTVKVDSSGYLNSINEGLKREIQICVYPNPFTSNLVIENSESICYELSIYSINGNEIVSKIICNTKEELNLDFLNSGMYFYVLRSDKFSSKNGKIIKN
jgi:hypothetical protein